MREAYEKYGRALVRKASRILQDDDDAKDVVQALFCDLFGKPPVSLDLPYLFRAVTNRCLTLLRDRNHRQHLLERRAPGAVPYSRSEDVFLDGDLVQRLVRELGDEESEILVCRFLDDMTLEEIAEVTGLSRKTVSKRLDHVRERVRVLGGSHP